LIPGAVFDAVNKKVIFQVNHLTKFAILKAAKANSVPLTVTKTVQEVKPVSEPMLDNQAKVLGVKTYADGTLLRDTKTKKIYIVGANGKYQIRTLKELKTYKGKKIIEVNSEVLDQYKDVKTAAQVAGKKLYGEGSLIRLKGDKKVYVIKGGIKKYISTPKELAKYGKKKINDIGAEEFTKY
jgi:hypothetical protein